MHMLITVFDPVISKTPDVCVLTLVVILQGKVVTF